MALYPVAGCHIYIGGVLSDKITDFIAADFASQVWTEIDGWVNAGPIGDSGQLITTPIINRGRDTKQKGTSNAGQMQNEFAQNTLDPGQILLLAASLPTDKNNRAFRVDLNDAVGGAPGKRFFIGLVMDFVEAGGGANTIRMVKSTFEVNSNIVRVAAT
jgi:hypothetical protein